MMSRFTDRRLEVQMKKQNTKNFLTAAKKRAAELARESKTHA